MRYAVAIAGLAATVAVADAAWTERTAPPPVEIVRAVPPLNRLNSSKPPKLVEYVVARRPMIQCARGDVELETLAGGVLRLVAHQPSRRPVYVPLVGSPAGLRAAHRALEALMGCPGHDLPTPTTDRRNDDEPQNATTDRRWRSYGDGIKARARLSAR